MGTCAAGAPCSSWALSLLWKNKVRKMAFGEVSMKVNHVLSHAHATFAGTSEVFPCR